MKKYIIAMILVVMCFTACHKDAQIEPKTPVITAQTAEPLATEAYFTWTVDFPGKMSSVVKIGRKADMSDAVSYGDDTLTSQKEYFAIATGLTKTTTYYYCYEVWNPGMSFQSEVYSFTTACPLGAIDGLFTVNSNGDQVYFSQGNLQYQASTTTWKFAENQYDVIGNGNSSISSSYNGWIDLFGWGTSGYNGKNPYMTSTTYTDYGNGSTDIAGTNYDWGVYNKITNGGNQAGLWRTLTKDEWVYVFNTRSTTSGIRYTMACVNNMNGVILLPDDWNSSYYSLSSTNSSGASFSSNTITASQWATLEQHGAVFLPASGFRQGTSVNGVGSRGHYWSASYYDSNYAYSVWFRDSDLNLQGEYRRYFGRSVRLVRSAQ